MDIFRPLTLILLFLTTSPVVGQHKDIYKELNTLYQGRLKYSFDSFMDTWERASRSKGKVVTMLTGMEKTIYQIHHDFFQPLSFRFYGWEAWEDRSWFTDTKYIVIQNKVPFKVVDNLDSLKDQVDCPDTIFNFRPQTIFNQATTLYLLPEYEDALKRFLDEECFREQGPVNPKTEFLEERIRTTLKIDWTTIITQPEIFAIYLSRDLKSAVIDYRLASTGMRSLLQKEHEHWVIKKSEELWIE
ncbi:hypothetical protein [Dawidia soli]|uniref:Uncharacterized protein n=1 Tax=Dawidia soli TaxID=2782352 RepID=A0AAP2D873_9BACT|nr:hypothetical protein [Dawidia soli]MBT1687256.1 hypothetical protein [Dawidia soli]